MLVTGRVFDRITLGALILGLGLLVDDAIISIEIMVVKMEEGWDRVRAAGYAWSHTAAPMLAGTLVTVIGLMPVGFAQSSAGEYAGNIFWVVGFALLTSWVVAVTFTPYLGVQMLPEIKALPGGHEAIYATPGYEKLRRLIAWAVRRKALVACIVLGIFLVSVAGMGLVKQQFFPQSDRPELLVEVTLPQGTSIETTNASSKKVEDWLRQQPEAKIVTAYIGAGAPRFFFSYNPELPNPNFAKIIVLTASEKDRDHLKLRLREQVEQGLAPEARVRASQLVFGPYSPWPVAFRVMGPNLDKDRAIAAQVQAVNAGKSPYSASKPGLGGTRANCAFCARPGPPATDRPFLPRCCRTDPISSDRCASNAGPRRYSNSGGNRSKCRNRPLRSQKAERHDFDESLGEGYSTEPGRPHRDSSRRTDPQTP